MNSIEIERLEEIFQQMREVRIAVVGDVMLDRYVWGRVERISPEAPVPIISLEGESLSLGGAANVAANVGSLGADVKLFGVIGDDKQGDEFKSLMERQGFDSSGIVIEEGRFTSVKTRVIAQNQHMLRIDRETTADINEMTAMKLLSRIGTDLSQFNAVILEDYNKGVLSPKVITQVIEVCRQSRIPVGVDPKHDNFWEYKGATLFKPNLRELEAAVAKRLADDGELSDTAAGVIERLEVEHLLVTRGDRGMMLFTGGKPHFIETQAHRVHDVSGAGDTVIATMMTALAAGADVFESAVLANYAASVVIAEVGAVPVDAGKLRRAVTGR